MKYLRESKQDIMDCLENFMDLPTKFTYSEVDLKVFDSGPTKNGIDAEHTEALGMKVLSFLNELRRTREEAYRFRKTSWHVQVTEGLIKLCFRYHAERT